MTSARAPLAAGRRRPGPVDAQPAKGLTSCRPGKAPKPSVEGHEGRLVVHGQRREVGVGHVVAGEPELLTYDANKDQCRDDGATVTAEGAPSTLSQNARAAWSSTGSRRRGRSSRSARRRRGPGSPPTRATAVGDRTPSRGRRRRPGDRRAVLDQEHVDVEDQHGVASGPERRSVVSEKLARRSLSMRSTPGRSPGILGSNVGRPNPWGVVMRWSSSAGSRPRRTDPTVRSPGGESFHLTRRSSLIVTVVLMLHQSITRCASVHHRIRRGASGGRQCCAGSTSSTVRS